MQWLLENKAKVGAVLTALVQALRAFPEVPNAIIEALTFITALLMGSGFLPSDSAVKKFGSDAK